MFKPIIMEKDSNKKRMRSGKLVKILIRLNIYAIGLFIKWFRLIKFVGGA